MTKKFTTRFHFAFLAIGILNFICKRLFEISLNHEITFLITSIIYITGIILFIWNFKPFKKITLYFLVFALTPLLAFGSWIIGGVFAGILASITLFPIYPNNIVSEQENFAIYSRFSGFLSACCVYELTEKKFVILEEKLEEIKIDAEIDFEKSIIYSENGIIKLVWEIENYDDELNQYVKSDSTILIKKTKN